MDSSLPSIMGRGEVSSGPDRIRDKSSTMGEKSQQDMDFKSTSRRFPGFDAIYVVDDPFDNKAFRGKLKVSVDEAFALTRGEWIPPNPVVVQRAMGRALKDIIWCTVAAPVLLSRRVSELFRSAGFTGWSTYPVILHLDDGTTTSDYSGLAVTGRCGPIDSSRSQIVGKQYPAGIFPILKGLYFDPQSWDGSDFFMTSEKTGFIFVVDEVKKCLDDARIRNIHLTPLDQTERMRP
jgi:hypothetical protein